MSRRARVAWAASLAFPLAVNLAACDFNGAFSRYCHNNPRCVPDAGHGPEARPSPDVGPPLKPDVAPDLRSDLASALKPDLAPDLRPDLAPDLGLDLVADAFAMRVDSWGMRPMGACKSPADCTGPMETCHPTALFCVPTCRSASDCPAGLDTCTEVRSQPGDSGPAPKICACSGSQACGQMAPNFRCNRTDKLCQPPCNDSADCSMFGQSRVCDPYGLSCVECVASTDCSNRSDGLTECDFLAGRCVKPR